MNRRVLAATVAILLVTAPVGYSFRAPSITYTVEDLGTTTDGYVPTVTGMNASGQVSGYVSRPEGPRAVRYTDGSGWAYVTGLQSVYSVATAINVQGDLTGYYLTPAGLRAYRYADGVGLTTIPALSGGTFGIALAIADNGDIAGYGNSASGQRAWRASVGGSPAVPAGLTGFTSMACGINNSGQMVGWFTAPGGFQHAFRVEADGSLTDVGTLTGAGTSTACALDADGRVGGRSSLGSAAHAFLFAGGAPSDIDSFGSPFSVTVAIANGVAVGNFTASPVTGQTRAFAYTDADGMFDLNDRIPAGTSWVLANATAVNANGQIAGPGFFGGSGRVFRLTPEATGDTTAPTISSLSASPSSITPPNQAMVAVSVSVTATDDQDPNPACSVTAIDGAPAADFSITGSLAGSVRATGGATYSFTVTCSDAAGNAASSSVDVVVPPDTTAPVMASLTATPSTVWPPNGALVPVTVSVSASDDSGEAPSCGLSGITSTGSTADDFSITGPFAAKVRAVGGRTYTLQVSCSDAAGNRSEASTDVAVPPDTTAPVITALSASPGFIWPPNGKMESVTVTVSATDDVDASPTCALTSISGALPANAVVSGPFSASVRSNKDAVYTLHVTCGDHAGNTAEGSVTVVVAKDAVSAAKAAARR